MTKEIISSIENNEIEFDNILDKYIFKHLYYFETLKELYKFQSKQQKHKNKKVKKNEIK
jgi:hypothetical protein